jgi:DNA-binding LacI/PurR family transcriptional regulator
MIKMATLQDVAYAADVSTRTVSRVVNDEPGFSESTRKHVLTAIKELGYRPNLAARSLITRRTQTIGLVASNPTDP